MFIVWGRKIRRRRLGYVADYCPMCRAQRVFTLESIKSVRHVYYVSLGSGQLLGHERRCEECGTSFKANPATYASVSKTQLSLDELRQATYPNLEAATREQVALDERIRRQKLSATERAALIKAPFLYLAARVERRFAATHVDAGVGLALAGALALLALAPVVTHWAPPDSALPVFLGALGLGAALVIWQVIASGPRFMRREIVPVLARALKPLQPTREELELVLGELKRVKQQIGRKLRAAELLESLQPGAI
jgi:hypothetical protein